MSRQSVLRIIVCIFLFASFGAAAASHAEEVPSDPAIATLEGVPEQDLELVAELSGSADPDQRAVRSDLGALARAWARAGGNDGFPFWERAYRRYQASEIEASALRDYTVSYRELLERAPGALDDTDVQSDVAEAVRQRLVRAVELRRGALALYVTYLEGRRAGTANRQGAELREQLVEAEADLQASYRLTRQAMNTSQAALDAAEQPRIAEGSFM